MLTPSCHNKNCHDTRKAYVAADTLQGLARLARFGDILNPFIATVFQRRLIKGDISNWIQNMVIVCGAITKK